MDAMNGIKSEPSPDRETGEALNERLYALAGIIEWLKTNLLKKGAVKKADRMDRLAGHAEKISRMVESTPTEEGRSIPADGSLKNRLQALEKAMEEMCGERCVIGEEDLEKVEGMFQDLEKKIKGRE